MIKTIAIKDEIDLVTTLQGVFLFSHQTSGSLDFLHQVDVAQFVPSLTCFHWRNFIFSWRIILDSSICHFEETPQYFTRCVSVGFVNRGSMFIYAVQTEPNAKSSNFESLK